MLADNLLDVMPGKLDSLLERLYTTARKSKHFSALYLAFALVVALTLWVEFFIATVCI